jgi:hypothetical protein
LVWNAYVLFFIFLSFLSIAQAKITTQPVHITHAVKHIAIIKAVMLKPAATETDVPTIAALMFLLSIIGFNSSVEFAAVLIGEIEVIESVVQLLRMKPSAFKIVVW